MYLARFLPRRVGFDVGPVHVRSLVGKKVALWLFYSYFGFTPSTSFDQCCTLFCMCMLLTPEGRTAITGEPSRRRRRWEKGEEEKKMGKKEEKKKK